MPVKPDGEPIDWFDAEDIHARTTIEPFQACQIIEKVGRWFGNGNRDEAFERLCNRSYAKGNDVPKIVMTVFGHAVAQIANAEAMTQDELLQRLHSEWQNEDSELRSRIIKHIPDGKLPN